MSLFLGFPYTIPEPLISTDCSSHGMTDEDRPLQDLNLFCGHVIDRNRDGNVSYSVTMRIAEAMDSLRSAIPEKWIDIDDAPIPLNSAFRRRVAMFHFHYVNILLHLPYMLKGRTDDRYRYSYTSAIASADIVLRAWFKLPSGGDVPVISGYLDFCALNAAVIIAADLMSAESDHLPEEKTRQWILITDTAGLLQVKAYVLGFTVSCQSAQLLQTLYAAHNGSYKAAGAYDVSVPCLGRITIKGPQTSAIEEENNCSGDSSVNIDLQSAAFGSHHPLELDAALELAADWPQLSLPLPDAGLDHFSFRQ